MEFEGTNYELNQCSDLFEWIQESLVGQYTHYYDKLCFHTASGFVAAYRGDLSNSWLF